MDDSERPEKRRKLDQVNDEPGSRSDQPRPMTLGERKRNGPRVLVNRLNLNNEIIERLRRVTKLWGKQTAVKKSDSQGNKAGEVNGLNDAENAPAEVGTNGIGNGSGLKNGVFKDAESKELIPEESKQGATPIPNDRKGNKANLVYNTKSEVDDDRVSQQTAEDVLTFKQVLKEVIEQRTKVVEEAIAANSVHLQNRIRELERQNRELRWSARKLSDAFKKYVAETEKTKQAKTSCGIQVNIETVKNSEIEGPFSRVISPSRDPHILVVKAPVSTIEDVVSPRVPSLRTTASFALTNTTLASRVAPQQSSPQVRPSLTSLAQPINSMVSGETAVVFTVSPRPSEAHTTQQVNKVPEGERRSFETRYTQLGQAVKNPYPQPQPLVQTESPTRIASPIQSRSQTNPNLDRINKDQAFVTQARSLLQQQGNLPHTSKPPAKQRVIIPSETTASLLQQLQRQQQLQQQQHYQQMQNRQLSAQSAPCPRQPDPSPQQIQQHSVAPTPVVPPSLVSTKPRNPNNGHQTAVSYSTTSERISLSNPCNQRSNLVTSNKPVCEHLNQPVNRSRGNSPGSPLLASTSAHVSKTSERREIAAAVKMALNGNYQKESIVTPDYFSRNHNLFEVAHGTTGIRREVLDIPRGASSTTVSTYNQFQPDIQSMQKSGVLVRARKMHLDKKSFLPSGYRIALPSPEYLLQQQQLQFESTSQHPKASQAFQMQSFQSKSPTGLGERPSQPPRIVTTRQTPAVQSHHEAATRSGYQPILTVPEKRPPQAYRGKNQQTQTSRSHFLPKATQEKHQEPSLTSEGTNGNVTLQSLHRPPIQSPGISSSDLRNERHSQDAKRPATENPTASSIPTNVKQITVNQGVLQKSMPKPSASIAVMGSSIVLSWNMEYDEAEINVDNYELFACQDLTETDGQPIKWKKIGIVKSLPLPMACTLTQFSSGSKYFFSVRAVDENERAGPFSDPCTVSLNSSENEMSKSAM